MNQEEQFRMIEETRYHLNKLKQEITLKHEMLTKKKKTHLERIEQYQKDIQKNEQFILVCNKSSDRVREVAKKYLEKTVTSALQFITQSTDYEFVIVDLENRAAPSYEFYIKSIINGEECLQKPEDANGGGFIDIISSTLKYAYLQLFKNPSIQNDVLLYDEPAKMVSADMSVRFAEYFKFLSQKYKKQIIMITHNENLASVADKTFQVSLNNNKTSRIESSE